MSVPGFELCSADNNSVSLSFSFWQKDALAFFSIFCFVEILCSFFFLTLHKRVEN